MWYTLLARFKLSQALSPIVAGTPDPQPQQRTVKWCTFTVIFSLQTIDSSIDFLLIFGFSFILFMSDMLIKFAFAPMSRLSMTNAPLILSGAIHLSSLTVSSWDCVLTDNYPLLLFSVFLQVTMPTKNVSLRTLSSIILTDLSFLLTFALEKHCFAKWFLPLHLAHCFPNAGHCLGLCSVPQRLQL